MVALDGWWVAVRPTLTNLCEVLVPKLYPETPNFFTGPLSIFRGKMVVLLGCYPNSSTPNTPFFFVGIHWVPIQF